MSDWDWVHFRIEGVRNAKVMRTRLGDLVLEDRLTLVDAHQPTGGDYDLLIRCHSSDAEEIADYFKAIKARYQSPSFFCNSRIQPIYDSPEDELIESWSEAYIRHRERRCGCCRGRK